MVAVLLIALLAITAASARAARPLLDKGQWDAYFALFARDVYPAWKPTTIRLDTYSGAPVDFAAYDVDPAEAISAGQNISARPVDLSSRKAAVRWRFSPPPGYRFEANDVAVPLGSREGFFVIEARRGEAVQQVWINRTKIGLLSKEGPEGILLYGADLQSGRRLRGMRISLVVGTSFAVRQTDDMGIVRWTDMGHRPVFALAEFGSSKAFVSFLPQPPVPAALVAARVENAALRAGERLQVVGFARKRSGAVYRPASGDVHVVLSARGTTFAAQTVHLDAAGAYSADLNVPANAAAGDYAVLASAAGATGGTSVHVDAVAGDLALAIAAQCGKACAADGEFPIVVSARRGGRPAAGVPIAARITRVPHIVPRAEAAASRRIWGSTTVLEQSATTDANGDVHFKAGAPSDGLASTYAVEASSGGATATASIKVASGKIALAIVPDRASLDIGEPVNVNVSAFDPGDGSPIAGVAVNVRATHGSSVSEQRVTTGRDGAATITLRNLPLGNVLLFAQADYQGAAILDAFGVSVRPRVLGARASLRSSDVAIELDRGRYGPKDRPGISATLNGAVGDALFTIEGARPGDARTVAVSGGHAGTQLSLQDAGGDVRAGVAFVRNGALVWAGIPVNVDGAGRPLYTTLAPDRQAYAPSETAKVAIDHGFGQAVGTVIVRLSEGLATGGADFDAVSDVLRAGATATQNPAAEEPSWHAWVAPARSKASDIFAYEPRGTSRLAENPAAIAATKTLFWKVQRGERSALLVPLPADRGRYVLSVIDVSDDGDVGAASVSLVVR